MQIFLLNLAAQNDYVAVLLLTHQFSQFYMAVHLQFVASGKAPTSSSSDLFPSRQQNLSRSKVAALPGLVNMHALANVVTSSRVCSSCRGIDAAPPHPRADTPLLVHPIIRRIRKTAAVLREKCPSLRGNVSESSDGWTRKCRKISGYGATFAV